MVDWDPGEGSFGKLPKQAGLAVGIVAAIGVIIFFASCVVLIPAGFEGVMFNKLTGRVSQTTLKQGWQLRMPVITRVVLYDCRRKDYTMSATSMEGQYKGMSDTNWSPTSDGNSVGLDITVWYRIPENTAGKVYVRLGDQEWTNWVNYFLDDYYSSGVSTCGCGKAKPKEWFKTESLPLLFSY